MVRAVLFDVDGVLVRPWGFRDALEREYSRASNGSVAIWLDTRARPGSGIMEMGTDPSLQLVELEQRLAEAWVKQDRAFIEGLLAPEWTVIDTTGRVLTRDDVLEETFGSADRSILSMDVDDLEVRLLGTVAIVRGRTHAIGSYRGEAASVTLRFTDVFHDRDGRWTIVASQGTVVPPAS